MSADTKSVECADSIGANHKSEQVRGFHGDLLAGLGAAAMPALAFVLSGILRGTFPFGAISRNTNDLGQQVIPMHTQYRDVLTGQDAGDLLFNWDSGFGVPFLGDFMAYLGTTLSWLVVLFPRDSMDLALFVIDTVAIALAAGFMAIYLRRLRPDGPVWLAAALGASYGMCAWAIDDAAYMTVWLNGLVAFPVLCLVCEWIWRRWSLASFIVSPLVVALLWTTHFYTVYMATLGAGIVVVARIVSSPAGYSWKYRLAGVLRCAAAVLLGIGLAAPLLAPTFRAVQYSRPSPDQTFAPISWIDFLSRLLAGTEGVGFSPGLAVGTIALLLALSLPFNRAVPARERVIWVAVVVLTMLSMQFGLTHEVWHGFDTPNGSPFRQAFIVAGMLVIVGWLSISRGIRDVVTIAGPVMVLGILYGVTLDSPYITPTTRVVVPAVAALALVGWALCRLGKPERRWLFAPGATVVLLAVVVEGAAAAAAIDEARAEVLYASPVWDERNDQIGSLVTSADDWPAHRVAPGGHLTFNDPMLIGGQGSAYYSSTIPNALSETLADLGFGYSSYGRAHVDPENPVLDAVFSIAGRVASADSAQPGAESYELQRQSAAPLVTVRPADPWQSDDPIPYGPQETALGADVYDVPEMAVPAVPGLTIAGRSNGDVVMTPAAGASLPIEMTFAGTCSAGSDIYLWSPAFVGEVRNADSWTPILTPSAKRPGVYMGAPVRRIGEVGPDGRVNLTLRISGPARLPAFPIGCLDRGGLASAVNTLESSEPKDVAVSGHSVEVALRPGTTGTVVLAVPRTPGWQCVLDDNRSETPGTVAGLIAVQVDGESTDISCWYRPPGMRMGLAAGGASLVSLVLLSLILARRPQTEDQR